MSKYWIERQEKRENLSFEKGTEAYKEYVKTLEQAKENINAKIAKLYANHSRDTGLSKAETMKIIQSKEYKEWRYKIEDYVKELNSIKDKNSIEFKKLSLELETLASRSRISRLESLKADIDMELIRAGAKTNDTMTNALTKTYTDTYKSLVDNLGFKSTVDMDEVKKVLGYDWSGSNYSKRIWSNTEALAKTVKNEVLIGINQGINYKTMSTRIADKFNTAYKNAEMLVRTEINYIHNQATLDSYKDAEVEKYQFLATLDSRTSDTCASLNGEVFEVKNIAVGINYPPMHPRCRSTTVPIIDYSALGKIKEEFTEKDESAIMRYIGAESYKINEQLRKGELLSEDFKNWTNELDKALDKAPNYKGIVTRSLDFKLQGKEALEKFLNEHTVGDIKEYSAYTSATTGETYNPDGVIQIQIVSKSGRDIRSLNSGEQEILFERKKRFIIIKRIKINNKYYFDMEEVDE